MVSSRALWFPSVSHFHVLFMTPAVDECHWHTLRDHDVSFVTVLVLHHRLEHKSTAAEEYQGLHARTAGTADTIFRILHTKMRDEMPET